MNTSSPVSTIPIRVLILPSRPKKPQHDQMKVFHYEVWRLDVQEAAQAGTDSLCLSNILRSQLRESHSVFQKV